MDIEISDSESESDIDNLLLPNTISRSKPKKSINKLFLQPFL